MMSVNQSVLGKAIAIVFVVFGHLGFIPKGGAIGVSLFLVLSGYGMAKSAKKNNYQLKDFWIKRIKGVYIPFLLCSLLTVCILYVTRCIINGDMEFYRIILGILGFPNNPYDPTMWYISYIFMMYISFWCSFKFFNTECKKVIMCFVLCLIFGVVGIFVYKGSIGISLYIVSFSIGVMTAIYEKKLKISGFFAQAYKFGLFVAFLIILEYLSARNVIFYIFLTTYISLFSIPILMHAPTIGNGLLFSIGQSSFAIYLVEGIIMKILWENIGDDKMLWNFVSGLCILCVGVLIHYCWKVIISFKLPKRGNGNCR